MLLTPACRSTTIKWKVMLSFQSKIGYANARQYYVTLTTSFLLIALPHLENGQTDLREILSRKVSLKFFVLFHISLKSAGNNRHFTRRYLWVSTRILSTIRQIFTETNHMPGKSRANIKTHVFWSLSVISDFRSQVDENCALLGYNLTTACPERSVRNYQYNLRNNPEECSSQLSLRLWASRY
jgi:hypothetical protein